MKILFVAFPDSIHTVRWISQIKDQGWELYLFPSVHIMPHDELQGCKVFHPIFNYWGMYLGQDLTIQQRISNKFRYEIAKRYKTHLNSSQALLRHIIQRVKPDIIHYLGFQNAGYLLLDALARNSFKSGVVMGSSWGSDIYLFGRLKEHKKRIQDLLNFTDYYIPDCERDISIAKHLGYDNRVLPVFPVTGSIDVRSLQQLVSVRPSQRKKILVKGYQNFAGRALDALEAIKLLADYLKSYQIVIYSASDSISITAELISEQTGLDIVIQGKTSHEGMLQLFAESRVHVGVSISDGLSNAVIESMVMGTFIIQSGTACLGGLLKDGENCILVPPNSPEGFSDASKIADALRVAITDDNFVDRSAAQNMQKVLETFDTTVIKPQIVDMYNEIYAGLRR